MTPKEMVEIFYRKCLTVNAEANPTELLNQLLHDDFASHGSADTKTKEMLIKQIGFFWMLVPNLDWRPQEILESGNKIVVRSIATGTPNGDFMGLSTSGNRSFRIMTIDIHEFDGTQVRNVYHLEDWGTAMKQLQA